MFFSEASGLAVTIFNKENLWLVLSPILISPEYSDSLKVAVGKWFGGKIYYLVVSKTVLFFYF